MAALLLAISLATAPPAQTRAAVGLTLTGSYVVSATSLGALRVDADGDGVARRGETWGQGLLAPHRLRFLPRATLHQWLTMEADLQLAAGYLAVDDPDPRFRDYSAARDSRSAAFGSGQDWGNQLLLRKLFVRLHTPVGQVIAGRMASHWGAGLLANGGDEDRPDWGGPRFGDDRNYGDLVDRLLFATTPMRLVTDADWANRWTLAFGAGLVERDEYIQWAAGDLAWEAAGALRYRHNRDEAGLYLAYRSLEDRQDETLAVWVLDLFARSARRIGDLEVAGVAEGVWVTGETTLARNNAFTGTLEVQQLGGIVRASAVFLPWGAGADVELGYASGDSNPNDGTVRDFRLDVNYNPSLVLFEELRAAESVAAAANASDPERVGYPAGAVRFLPSQGAVSNAIYIRPTLRVKPPGLFPWGDVTARVALLYAVAEEDVVDPYASSLAGGVAVNHQGGEGGERDLGFEIDVGIDIHGQIDRWVAIAGTVQYGRLFPGAAFDNAGGVAHPPVDVWFARLAVQWLPPAPTEE
jgi:hypothetical protein